MNTAPSQRGLRLLHGTVPIPRACMETYPDGALLSWSSCRAAHALREDPTLLGAWLLTQRPRTALIRLATAPCLGGFGSAAAEYIIRARSIETDAPGACNPFTSAASRSGLLADASASQSPASSCSTPASSSCSSPRSMSSAPVSCACKYMLEETLLHAAASSGSTQMLCVLACSGWELNRLSSAGLTPLHAGIANDQYDAISELLQLGADPSTADSFGNNALQYACRCARPAAVRVLLKAGALPNQAGKDAAFDAPLHIALLLEPPNEDLVHALLEGGADPNALNNESLSPLMLALLIHGLGYGQAVLLVRRLCEAGADPLKTACFAGQTATPLAVAERTELATVTDSGMEIVRILRAHAHAGAKASMLLG